MLKVLFIFKGSTDVINKYIIVNNRKNLFVRFDEVHLLKNQAPSNA